MYMHARYRIVLFRPRLAKYGRAKAPQAKLESFKKKKKKLTC